MTQELAAELFDLLMSGLRQHGLTEVVTFALPESSVDRQYSEFDDNYRYDSTETEIRFLGEQARNGDEGAFRSLNSLVRAGASYFDSVGSIAESFAGGLEALAAEDGETLDPVILLEMTDGSVVDLSQVLQNPAISRLSSLMHFIEENQYLEDAEFEERLEAFSNNLGI